MKTLTVTVTKEHANDGIPGDLHEDSFGNDSYEAGEPFYSNGVHNDWGLDGIQAFDIDGDGFYISTQ